MTTPDKEKMPTETRTAGPWRQSARRAFQIYRGDDEDEHVATTFGSTHVQSLANAQFIVTACNAYEPMREALNALRVDRDYWNADARRLSAGLLAIHRADESVPASVLRGIAYDISLNCIPQDVAEFQIEERSRAALSTLPVNDRQTSDDVGRLREALEATTAEIERDLNDYLSSVCVVRDDVPDRSTMEPEDAEEAARLEEVISRARAALKGPASEAGKLSTDANGEA